MSQQFNELCLLHTIVHHSELVFAKQTGVMPAGVLNVSFQLPPTLKQIWKLGINGL